MFSLAENGARDAIFHVYEAAFLEKVASHTIALSLVANPGLAARGVVREVSPSADTASGTVRVKVSIDDPPPEFALGSVVSGCATLASRQVVVLPASALSTLDGQPAVWIVDADTREVSLKPVSVASYESLNVIIDGGLEPGDRVVTAGAKVLRPHQIVTFTAENAS